MKSKKTNKFIGYISLLLIFVLVFTGCNASLFSYSGATVDMDNRIALLKGRAHKGSWNTPDLAVNYNYKMDANVLQLSGQVEFDNQIHKFTSLYHFSLWIYFIGKEGNIVSDRVIAMADYRKQLENISFDHNIEIPSSVNSIAFGYDGTARESGEDAATWDFWKVPHR